MKTFFNLIQDVRKQGKCHHCGGCVTFCSAINYGALKTGEDGRPDFADIEKCIECGICHMICPETGDDHEIRKEAGWTAPGGRTIGTSVARAGDLIIRERGTDGGVVTALLLHLFDTKKINGAVVSRNMDSGRTPWLATSREEIIDASGSHFDSSHGMARFGEAYSTFSPSVKALAEIRKEGLEKIAFVGTPCQINTIRRMQALGVVPADSIVLCLGLFCSGNYTMTKESFKPLEQDYNFDYHDIEKMNIKENVILRLTTGELREIPINALDPAKRTACRYCGDFSAEFADISFGGIGADDGWTTVITRTDLGHALFTQASEKALELYSYKQNPNYATQAEAMVLSASSAKKRVAKKNRKDLESGPVTVIS
ncbi:MAG: Coenzyme F420 hydrogenase/dehydrogenase, beta subunit C-terminal domain [Desulfobacterium sp.]|nr:Coenzyme F420 hydrogenase/dehydrogenase, beta subunit C-terminal domain [Desulfobacterium sp.]